MIAPRNLLALLFVIVGLAGGGWFLSQALTGSASDPAHATVLPAPRALEPFTLTDHRGNALTRDALTGKPHLLFFGFTHCPDICPATLQQLAVARKRLSDRGMTPLPDIVLISVDPARDTPERLAEYVAHFGPGVSGATGNTRSLAALAASLGIYYERPAPDAGDDYNVNHSAAVLVLDERARNTAIFSAPHTVEAFVTDLPLILSGS